MTRGDLERPLDLCVFLITTFIIIFVIIIIIHVHNVWKRSCVMFLRTIEGTVALTQSTHITIIYTLHTHVLCSTDYDDVVSLRLVLLIPFRRRRRSNI